RHPRGRARPDHVRDPLGGGCHQGRRDQGGRRGGRPSDRRPVPQAQERLTAVHGERPAPWRVVTSTPIVTDRWIDLRADTCVDASGRTIAPYYVLDPADWITVLALDEDGRAVTVDEY